MKGMVGTLATLALLTACSSGPKVSKNPGEEAALQKNAQEVIAKGQTASAKAGGYDAISFWKNRHDVAESYTKDIEEGILSKSKIVYLLDFKVKFLSYGGSSLEGGHGFFDRAMDSGSGFVTIKEQKQTDLWVIENSELYQKITDSLHQDFVKRLQEAGYEVRSRESMNYPDMKKYLASEAMVAGPLTGDLNERIFAPTGWKLEERTAKPSLSAAFGDTLMKLGEQHSRKVQESIGMSATYVVNLGRTSKNDFKPRVKVNGQVDFTTTYYGGAIRMTKDVADGLDYKYTTEVLKHDDGALGKLGATLLAQATGAGGSYRSSVSLGLRTEPQDLEDRINTHLGYASDILFQKIREGRDD